MYKRQLLNNGDEVLIPAPDYPLWTATVAPVSYTHLDVYKRQMFNTPCEIKPISPVLAKAMDKIFILHADHEQNASTSTVRLAGSSGANPFACIRCV